MNRFVRFLPAAALLIVAAVALASGVLDDLSIAGIEAHRAKWAAEAQAHPILSLAVFILGYATLAGAGLPVALVLTLTSGLVFGAIPGGLATATGATLAAMAGYLAARYALADWAHRRIADGGRLERLVKTLRERGFWYLLGARLMPLMPFNLLNFSCGVAKVPVRSYALATVMGAIPTSLIYAGLGAGLGEGLSAGHVTEAVRSPTIWLPLAGLAVLSLLPALIQRKA